MLTNNYYVYYFIYISLLTLNIHQIYLRCINLWLSQIELKLNFSGVWRWLSSTGHNYWEYCWSRETSSSCLESKCRLCSFVQMPHRWLPGYIVCPFFRQFYQECDIFGTIDFVLGNAAVVFQGCNIWSKMPLHGQYTVIQHNLVTAHLRTLEFPSRIV